MLKIAVIGGGRHSCGSHLPSLTRYAFQHPDEISLVAFCDASHQVAADIAGKYGFHRCYTDIGEMLAQEGLDGCIAITPVTETTDVAKQVISAGVPLLMEKPPGRTPDETKDICELTSQTNTPVMVSMNRRFHPGLCAANSWRGDRS